MNNPLDNFNKPPMDIHKQPVWSTQSDFGRANIKNILQSLNRKSFYPLALGVLFLLSFLFFIPEISLASLEIGKKYIQEGKFEIAYKEVIGIARQGNAEAQAIIGDMFATGRGVPKNIDKAIDWYAAKNCNRMNGRMKGTVPFNLKVRQRTVWLLRNTQ